MPRWLRMGGGSSKNKNKYLLETLVDHENSIDVMCLSEDGSLLVTGSEDCTARMWSTKTEETECLGVLRGHTSYITCALTCDTFVFTGSKDGTISKFDMTTCERIFTYIGHTNSVNRLICTGEFVFSSSADKTARCWLFDITDLGEELEEKACVRLFSGHSAWIHPIMFIPAEDVTGQGEDVDGEERVRINPGDLLITGSADNTARSWSVDSETGKCLKVFRGHRGPISSMATNATGKILYTASSDGTVRSWDIPRGSSLKVMEGHKEGILCMLVWKRLIYTGGSDGIACCWVPEFGDCTRVYKGHGHSVTSIKYHNGILFTGCGDAKARAFDAKSGGLKRTFEGHENVVTCLQAVDNKLFTGSADGRMMVWDISGIIETLDQPEPETPQNEDFMQRQDKRLMELEQRLEGCGPRSPTSTEDFPADLRETANDIQPVDVDDRSVA